MKDVLIFSVALNGYQWLYQKHLRSQQRYARKIGADYCTVKYPSFVSMGTECCWLKIPLMLAALNAGYKSVLFVDADAMIQEDAPDIRNVERKGSAIYMAKGVSKRWNSGVIYAINHPTAFQYLNAILDSKPSRVERQHDVGWGENGHVIQQDALLKVVAELPVHWNNTYDLNCQDYIRHFSVGAFRTSKVLQFTHKVLHWVSARLERFGQRTTDNRIFEKTFETIVKRYAHHFSSSESRTLFSRLVGC